MPPYARLLRGVLVLCMAASALAADPPASAPAAAKSAASKPSTSQPALLFDADSYLGHIKYLASDELEGRRPGTPGIEAAAEYIAKQFADAGLEPAGENGTYFQTFEVRLGKKIEADAAKLTFTGVEQSWQVEKDWIPLPLTATQDIDEAPLAFAGYGIRNVRAKWDDYADFDAKDKVLLIFRYEPPANDPNADFGGKTPSRQSMFSRKVQLAQRQGAKALLVVNPVRAETADDPLFAWDDDMSFQTVAIPIVHVKRELAAAVLKAAGAPTLDELQQFLDKDRDNASRDLDLKVTLHPGVKPNQTKTRNVLGLIKGREDPDSTIVIGAHYDHLGRVTPQFGRTADAKPEIHNGADDNASGTAGVIELAKSLGHEHLRRSVLCMTFSGEEMGLLGSFHWIEKPTVPLENVKAMLNFDMIGRFGTEKFTIFGVRSGAEFRDIVDRLAEKWGLEYRSPPGIAGNSDHAGFHAKNIPVLFAFTGVHKEYHRPQDDWQLIDAPGACRVLSMFHDVLVELANCTTGPKFVTEADAAAEEPEVKPGIEHAKEAAEKNGGNGENGEGPASQPSAKARPRDRGGEVDDRSRPRARLGIIPDFSGGDKPGVVADTVMDGGPAKAAGMQDGDRIIKIGDQEIRDIYGYMEALKDHKPGDTLEVVVVRKDQEVKLQVKLDEAPPPKGQ
jgi:hypothetical protein